MKPFRAGSTSRMRAAFAIMVVLGSAPLATRPAVSQDADSAGGLAGSYRTYNLFLGQTGDNGEQDLLFSAGQAHLWGARGGWTLRGGLGGGVSLWGSTRDAGFLLGGRIGLMRTWPGEYLELGGPTELYVVADGGTYLAWNMEETPGERSLIPVASAGLGLRFRGERTVATFEILWEERIGAWARRLIWRLGIHVPRAEPAPAASRPHV